MEKANKIMEKILVAAAVILSMLIIVVITADICAYERTTGEVVSVEQTEKGDYRVGYRYEAKYKTQTSFCFVDEKPNIGDQATIRYEREYPFVIREDAEFVFAGVILGVAVTTFAVMFLRGVYVLCAKLTVRKRKV